MKKRESDSPVLDKKFAEPRQTESAAHNCSLLNACRPHPTLIKRAADAIKSSLDYMSFSDVAPHLQTHATINGRRVLDGEHFARLTA
jgi:hypothetical protein